GDFARWGRRDFLTVTKTRGLIAMAMPGFPYTTACSPNRNTLPGALHVANLHHRNGCVPHDFVPVSGHIAACPIPDQPSCPGTHAQAYGYHDADRAVPAGRHALLPDPPVEFLHVEPCECFDCVEIAVLCLCLGHIVREIAGRNDPDIPFRQPLRSDNLFYNSCSMGGILLPHHDRNYLRTREPVLDKRHLHLDRMLFLMGCFIDSDIQRPDKLRVCIDD